YSPSLTPVCSPYLVPQGPAHPWRVAPRGGSDEAPSDRGRKALRGAGGSRNLAGHLAGLDARGAGVHALGRATDTGADGLDVGVPAAAGATVRVGNTVTEPWSLAADVADGSHGNSIQALRIAHVAAREGSSDRKVV